MRFDGEWDSDTWQITHALKHTRNPPTAFKMQARATTSDLREADAPTVDGLRRDECGDGNGPANHVFLTGAGVDSTLSCRGPASVFSAGFLARSEQRDASSPLLSNTVYQMQK